MNWLGSPAPWWTTLLVGLIAAGSGAVVSWRSLKQQRRHDSKQWEREDDQYEQRKLMARREAAASFLAAWDRLVKYAQAHAEGFRVASADQRLRTEFVEMWSDANPKGYSLMVVVPDVESSVSWMIGRLERPLNGLVNLDFAGDHDVVELAAELRGEIAALEIQKLAIARTVWGKKVASNFAGTGTDPK